MRRVATDYVVGGDAWSDKQQHHQEHRFIHSGIACPMKIGGPLALAVAPFTVPVFPVPDRSTSGESPRMATHAVGKGVSESFETGKQGFHLTSRSSSPTSCEVG